MTPTRPSDLTGIAGDTATLYYVSQINRLIESGQDALVDQFVDEAVADDLIARTARGRSNRAA
ncbi:MAG: hypothetical protein JWN61_1655 [Pseudonocardiales bacterium]|nr:hypothetical protein [Pseudonocardiales bacterium]